MYSALMKYDTKGPDRASLRGKTGKGILFMAQSVQDAPVAEKGQRLDVRIWLLALVTFVMGTDVLIVIGVLPVIARALRVTEGQAGQLITVFSLVYGLGGPLLAALV